MDFPRIAQPRSAPRSAGGQQTLECFGADFSCSAFPTNASLSAISQLLEDNTSLSTTRAATNVPTPRRRELTGTGAAALQPPCFAQVPRKVCPVLNDLTHAVVVTVRGAGSLPKPTEPEFYHRDKNISLDRKVSLGRGSPAVLWMETSHSQARCQQRQKPQLRSLKTTMGLQAVPSPPLLCSHPKLSSADSLLGLAFGLRPQIANPKEQNKSPTSNKGKTLLGVIPERSCGPQSLLLPLMAFPARSPNPRPCLQRVVA